MTVNLAAVAAARSELRAIVARYPELTTAAAAARLAAALPEVLMSRPIDPSRQSVQVGVRLSPDMTTAIDREVSRLQGAAIGATIGRSDAIRGIILRWMADQARALVEPVVSAPAAPPAPAPQASPPARALSLVEPVVQTTAPPAIVASKTRCERCFAAQVSVPCAANGCLRSVLVCGCEDCDARCPDHRHTVEPVMVSHPFASVASPPASDEDTDEDTDTDSLRAKLRRLQASEEGTSVKVRKWSYKKIAAAAGLGGEATVRRWLSGKNIEAPALASLAAYLRALPEV